jgi:diacylglycerol kinase family enzyme
MAEGHLDVRLFDESDRFSRLRLLFGLLLGRLGDDPDYSEKTVTSIRVERETDDLLAHDGEIGMAPADLTFSVDPRRLTVFRP